MTQRKTIDSTIQKLRNADWETIIVSSIIASGMLLMLGAAVWGDLDKRRILYKPGESLTKKERAAVDSLHDASLEHAKKKYNMYLQDYKHAMNCPPVNQWKNKPLPKEHRMPYPYETPTVGDYYKFLKEYEQDVIEKQYLELNAKIKQK